MHDPEGFLWTIRAILAKFGIFQFHYTKAADRMQLHFQFFFSAIQCGGVPCRGRISWDAKTAVLRIAPQLSTPPDVGAGPASVCRLERHAAALLLSAAGVSVGP